MGRASEAELRVVEGGPDGEEDLIGEYLSIMGGRSPPHSRYV